MGNLASVFRAIEKVGHTPFIAGTPAELDRASHVVLPGVGAFVQGMQRLDEGGWSEALRTTVAAGKPLLGICLGMQFLADRGDEGGPERAGLGFVAGEIRPLAEVTEATRIPHIGWNALHYARTDMLFDGVPDETDFYFVHSYVFRPTDMADLLATVDYGGSAAAVVRRGNVWGTQFHPEKSSRAGLRLLRNFVELARC